MSEITIRHDGKCFYVQFPGYTPAKDRVKAAGFRFVGAKSRWETTSSAAVDALVKKGAAVTEKAAAAVEVARGAHEAKAKLAETSVAASAATDADVQIPVPEGLAYLPYQRAGIAYAMARPDTLIADEPGLGKTIQAVGIVNADPSARRVLIVCPASLKLNWAREFAKWDVKGLSVGVVKSGKGLPATDVVILNYEIVGKLRPAIDAVAWDVLVCDEAHYLKNGKAARTKAVVGGGRERAKPIVARRRVFLTGTPILNRPAEIWTAVRSLDPEGLGSDWRRFVKRYCGAYDNGFALVADGATHLDELQVKLRASIMVRRLKKDVLAELPAKRRQLLPLDPTPEIRRLLKAMEESHAENERRIADLKAKAKEANKRGDREGYREIASEIREAGQQAFREISRHRRDLAVAKAPAVVDHVRETLESEDCLIVMAHHKDVVDVVVSSLEADGVRCSVVTGDTAVADRQAAVDGFQAGETRVFVGTIQAAGVGLTLTRASTVVFAELDWTPGGVSQAEDRAHRIGQRNSVLIQHLVVDGSLDAKFVHLLVEKQAVLDAALDDGDPAAKTMAAERIYYVADAPAVEATTTEEAAAEAFESAVTAHEDERAQVQADRAAARTARHATAVALLDGLSPAAVEAAYDAVRLVAAMDGDRAMEENGVGFSKRDVDLGHRLAELPVTVRDPVSDAYAVKLARIYRRQVPEALAVLYARPVAVQDGRVDPADLALGAVTETVVAESSAAGMLISLEHLRTGYVLAEEVERSVAARMPERLTLAA